VLRINWFSPLPPAQSGIAHYAMKIVPVLAASHDVVLWTDQAQVAPEVYRLARVARYDSASPPWRELNNAAISIYHLGNHPDFHQGIWQVSRRLPGIIVLHDLCLHDFFYMFWVHHRKDRPAYLRALECWYGSEGRDSGEAFCAGGLAAETMAQQFPLTREALDGALGTITHSSGVLEAIHETPACPVAALPFPYPAADDVCFERRVAIRHAAQHPPYRLVIFGYLSRNRRLEALLEALAGIPQRNQFRLEICGQLWDESHIRTQIERLRLTSLVSLHGFLPENQVEQKLSTADLAINLRYPSMGEASLSQLQFWDYGLPTLVTRTGWYASLPESATAFVRPEHEVNDIQTHLTAFLSDPRAFQQMGERGRQELANHDPAKYVEAMLQFASEALNCAARVPALALAQRVGSDLSEWLHPSASQYLLDRASRAITTLVEGSDTGA
jgi:glycosyltransferase involved in cell wall biosynthesis